MTVFLKLYHGRFDPDQDMEEAGFDGPVFEAETVRGICNSWLSFWDGREWELLRFYEDMLFYDGAYYGEYIITAEYDGELSVYDYARAMAFALKGE